MPQPLDELIDEYIYLIDLSTLQEARIGDDVTKSRPVIKLVCPIKQCIDYELNLWRVSNTRSGLWRSHNLTIRSSPPVAAMEEAIEILQIIIICGFTN